MVFMVAIEVFDGRATTTSRRWVLSVVSSRLWLLTFSTGPTHVLRCVGRDDFAQDRDEERFPKLEPESEAAKLWSRGVRGDDGIS